MNKKSVILVAVLLVIFSFSFVRAAEGIGVSSVLIKATVNEGDSVEKTLSVSGGGGGDFDIEVITVPGVEVSEKDFFISGGEKKNIGINFSSEGVQPGIYVGSLEISGPVDSVKVPLIFEIESQDIFFDANIDIPPVYTEIERGSKIVYQVKVFDLTSGGGLQKGLGPQTVEIEYAVSDLDGGVILTRSEQLVVDKQSQITNTISFPAGVELGSYILSATVKYQTSLGISSQIFDIKEGGAKEPGLIDFSDYGLLIVVLVALVIFLGVILLFVYLLRERDKILIELRKYNVQEIKNVKEILYEQERILVKKKRRVNPKKEFQEKIEALRKKQASRVSEIKKLKSKGDVSEMRRKLREWERQGYNISPMEYKMKELSRGDMVGILKNWKKKYSLKKEKPKVIKSRKNSKKKRREWEKARRR